MDFLNNPILLSILRLTHIISGMIWVGFGVVGAWIIYPAANKMGEKGDKLLRLFYAYTNYNKVFPVVAILTVLAGLIMWGSPTIVISGMDLSGFTNLGDIVMVIGTVFGLLAFGHGAAATGRFADVYAKAAQEYEEAENPSDEQKTALSEARAKNQTHANISAALVLIAVIAMAGARYLP